MTMTLLLPWFPIVLVVGIGGHLLGRSRGLGLGVACALFWVVLAQAANSTVLWTDAWTALSLVAGSAAIVCMGAWAGRDASKDLRLDRPDNTERGASQAAANVPVVMDELASLTRLFNEWLPDHATQRHPWPAFGEFVRSALYQVCHATHIKPYRFHGDDDSLVPLREADPLSESQKVSTRRGVIGHVLTSGRSFVAGDSSQGPLVEELAAAAERSCAWCFPIIRGSERLGVVVVEHLEINPAADAALLTLMEELIVQFWRTFDATIRHHAAEQTDPVSNLPTRPAFLHCAAQATQDSYAQGEPVALALFSVEGVRELTDHGQWRQADELVAEVSRTLLGKLRTDDRVGRFDGSRFVVLFRRVDTELAALIVNQVMLRLETVCEDEPRWGRVLKVRAALAGSGTDQPELETLVTRTLDQSRRARLENIRTATDLHAGSTTASVP